MSATTPPPLARVECSAEEQAKAAVQIQRYYRGHRERRELKGLGLTPNQRLAEALKEAHYRQVAHPTSREKQHLASGGGSDGQPSVKGTRRVSGSREKWEKAVLFARQLQHDDEPSSSSSDDDSGDEETRKKRKQEKRAKKLQIRKERIEYSKAMDMQYFLEMVDLKHRYGSNLRAYHSYWQSQPTLENFFYWLDHGAGRTIDLSICPRTQLASECVRYLSREERQAYLVKIDKEGRLCWAKNGERIDTTEKYHDSAAGIVPVGAEDATAAGSIPHEHAHHHTRRRSNTTASRPSTMSSSAGSFSSSGSSKSGQSDVIDRHADPAMQEHHSVNKVFHVSASTVLNRLLRGTTKKNTWIFVVDNSFRLYVGIKQSGAFQHSSFLHGARVSAAGMIKIKNGRLSSLSPLSGHYRPPTNNFRKFVESLKKANVDMSHVSISKSYAILVGLEAYGNFRKGKGKAKRATKSTANKVADKAFPSDVLHKDKGKEKESVEQYQLDNPTHYSADGTADGALVGQPDKALKKTLSMEEKKRDENNFALRFMKKLRFRPSVPKTAVEVEGKAKQ